MSNDLSLKIKEIRVSRCMSQADVAAKMNVSDRTVSSWENGTRNPKDILGLAEALQVSVNVLTGEIPADIGQRIRSLRVAHCLTQEKLGRMVGVEKAAINKYETGRVVNLKRDVVLRLAEVLNSTPEYILGFALDKDVVSEPFDEMLIEAYHDAPLATQKAIRLLLGLEVES